MVLTGIISLAAAGAAHAATFKATKAADTNDGACKPHNCSLRDAILASDAIAGPSTIKLPAGHYKLTKGELLVDKSVAVEGVGASKSVIDGGGNTRLFEVTSGANFAASGLTMTGGHAPASAAEGGAIYDHNGGSLRLTNVLIAKNSAASTSVFAEGGAVFDQDGAGPIVINRSTFTGNQAISRMLFADGGAIYAQNIASTAVSNSTFDLNEAIDTKGGTGDGGAIELDTGKLALTRVTMTSNRAGSGGARGYGGAVEASSSLVTVASSVFEFNRAGGGSSGFANGYGGAIDVDALNASASVFVSNQAGGGVGRGYGGAIEADSSVSMTRAIVAYNRAGVGQGGYGGGIESDGTLSLAGTTVSSNTAGGSGGYGFGGGIEADGNVTVARSTISGNSSGGGGASGDGGGIDDSSYPINVIASTISGNNAGGSNGDGGGVEAGTGSASLSDSEVVNNTAHQGGGVDADSLSAFNSIIADNSASSGSNCNDTSLTDDGFNLDSGTSCGFTQGNDIQGEEPLLGPLKDNGGPTPTRALRPGSPAIDHGPATGCQATDQRGVKRPQGPACDIGPYELAPPSAITGQAKVVSTAVRLTGKASNPDVVRGSVYFQWGKTKAYGHATPLHRLLASTANRPFAAFLKLTSLARNTYYHFRIVATNPDGTRYGVDVTFKTPKM